MNYIRWFQEIGVEELSLVGGKGANLGELTRAGLPVPPGFCITATAYHDFLKETGLDQAIETGLEGINLGDRIAVEAKSAHIRRMIAEQPLPDPVSEQIVESYHRLRKEIGSAVSDFPVAVRSSATAEDQPGASFAGQFDTYLNIRGEAALLAHVQRCWSSMWTERVVNYMEKQGFDPRGTSVSVVVQAMIPSEVAGVMFTANPVNGDPGEAVINASWGLGEAIVSGQVSPDTLTVRKSDCLILSRQIAVKERMIEYSPGGGTVEREVPAGRQAVPALVDGQIQELTALGNRIEAYYGSPQDIEWGYSLGRFYILQARPITTLNRTEAPVVKGNYNRTMFIEIFPDPLSPIFLSVISPLFQGMLDFTFETLGFKAPQGFNGTGIFYNQVYFNRDYIAASLSPLSPAVREPLVAQILNPFGQHQENAAFEFSLPFMRMTARILRFIVRFPAQLPGLLARYRAEIAEVEALPMDQAADSEIAGRIVSLLFESANKLLNYDFLMIAVIGRTYRFLGALLQRYYGEETGEVVAKLISGVTGNVTMEANKRLWDLAQVARSFESVCEILRSSSEEEINSRLSRSPGGISFLAALEDFLEEFGHREIRMDILYPTWREDPAPVFSFVRSYLDADEAQSPHRQQERLIRERGELTEAVLRKVEQRFSGRLLVSPVFRWILRQTQVHTRERDTMHFELTRMFPPFRRLLLELGRRWSERGLLERQEDVFFLAIDEIVEIARTPRSMKEVVAPRIKEFKTNQARLWPDIIQDGIETYARGDVPGEAPAGVLQGVAGSPGRVTGKSQVIRGPEEFGKLQKGDILVAPITNPVWTPLFAIAGGVITEVGGILSHGAIVAREYGIPAVMSVPGATKRLEGSQQVTVDGNKGTVYLEMEAVQ